MAADGVLAKQKGLGQTERRDSWWAGQATFFTGRDAQRFRQRISSSDRSSRNLRSPHEINMMRPAGIAVWRAPQIAREMSKSPFPGSTCMSINEQVVHGIPGNRELVDGDILTAPPADEDELKLIDVVA